MTARIPSQIRIGRRRNPTLARDLDAFRTQAELLELAAVLDRYDDAEAQPLRELVDWTRAA